MVNELLTTLSQLFHYSPASPNHKSSLISESEAHCVNSTASEHESFRQGSSEARRDWCAAIAAQETLLKTLTDAVPSTASSPQGVIICGPVPVLSSTALAHGFYQGIFSQIPIDNVIPLQLPSAKQAPTKTPPISTVENDKRCTSPNATTFPLPASDPLAAEQFCLTLTPWFSLLLVLGNDERSQPTFQFSFEPDVIAEAWQVLRSRLSYDQKPHLDKLDKLTKEFEPIAPDYRLVTQFARLLLQSLPVIPTVDVRQRRRHRSVSHDSPRQQSGAVSTNQWLSRPQSSEKELLKALTHEIRTPLTTIRTTARLLLKNSNLSEKTLKQLESIDHECTEQIARMELIFRAVELETKQDDSVNLVRMSLSEVLKQGIPRWQKQAKRRNVALEVILPQALPQVASDPAMFNQVLTGLIEKFTRGLPMGGKISLAVTTAGNQLKLQFHTQSSFPINPFKSLGQLLMFQPETGSLSLNLNVTKNLFQALGGKLIVRQRSQAEEIFTIFFPLQEGGQSVDIEAEACCLGKKAP